MLYIASFRQVPVTRPRPRRRGPAPDAWGWDNQTRTGLGSAKPLSVEDLVCCRSHAFCRVEVSAPAPGVRGRRWHDQGKPSCEQREICFCYSRQPEATGKHGRGRSQSAPLSLPSRETTLGCIDAVTRVAMSACSLSRFFLRLPVCLF